MSEFNYLELMCKQAAVTHTSYVLYSQTFSQFWGYFQIRYFDVTWFSWKRVQCAIYPIVEHTWQFFLLMLVAKVHWNSSVYPRVMKTRNIFKCKIFLRLFFKCLDFSRYFWRFAWCERRQKARADISYWCFSTKTGWNWCATSRSHKKAYIQIHFSNFRWILQIFLLFMLFVNVL